MPSYPRNITSPPNDRIEQAAALIAAADGLIITAGAGMGVDSGLPDFRGKEGFWRAYPALKNQGIEFTAIANPRAFTQQPHQAWGFYGHRLALYRQITPHAGFTFLRRMAARCPHGAFIITSNVDGQFQKAGFDPQRVWEIHGSIHHLQCSAPCRECIWNAADMTPRTDDTACAWLGELPRCPACGAVARPNILMFNDNHWLEERSELQSRRWENWRQRVTQPVVIECGAGTAIPSIRRIGETEAMREGTPLIRINRYEADLSGRIHSRGVTLAMGALEALEQIAARLDSRP